MLLNNIITTGLLLLLTTAPVHGYFYKFCNKGNRPVFVKIFTTGKATNGTIKVAGVNRCILFDTHDDCIMKLHVYSDSKTQNLLVENTDWFHEDNRLWCGNANILYKEPDILHIWNPQVYGELYDEVPWGDQEQNVIT